MGSRLCLNALAIVACAASAAPVKVFLLSGQSNMVGSGKVQDLLDLRYTVPSNVKLFRDLDGCPERAGCLTDDHTWRPLRVDANDWGFGPEMGIAEVLSKKYPNETLYFLKVAWGGTGLYPWPSGNLWEFNDALDGWTAAGTTGAFALRGDGTAAATITGNDPQILSPDMNGWNVAISKDQRNILRLKYRNLSSSTVGQIYFLTEGGQWSEANSKRFAVVANDPISREYVVDMATVPGWNGNLRQLRLDPSTAASGSFQVDYIRMQDGSSMARQWEFARTNNTEGWSSGNALSTLQWNGDGSVGAQIQGSDPFVFSPNLLNANIDSSRTLRIRLWNKTTDNQAQVYFVTDASTGWDESKSKVFTITPKDSGYSEYIVDMSDVPGWKGNLRQLRIDPVRTATSGSFLIDYVRLTGWASIAWLNTGSDLYPWFLRNVRKALADLTNSGLTYSIEGMFWMQGESDGCNQTTALRYDQSLSEFVAKVRSDLSVPSLPFVYGMIRDPIVTPEQDFAFKRPSPYYAKWSDDAIKQSYLPELWPFGKELQFRQFKAQSSISNARCVEGPSQEPTMVDVALHDPAHYGSTSQLAVGRHFGNGWNEYTSNPASKGCRNPKRAIGDLLTSP